MKKILILTYISILGGVEKALVNVLKCIDYSKYDVDLFFYDSTGPIRQLLPKEIKVVELIFKDQLIKEYFNIGARRLIPKYLKEFNLIKTLKILKYKISKKNLNYKDFYPIKKRYDLAICYHMHFPFLVQYVAEYVQADYKIAFIHSEIINNKHFYNRIFKLKKYLDKYNYFYTVSEQVKKDFLYIFSEYTDKTKVKYNNVITEEIVYLAKERIDWIINNDYIRIVTVARLNEEKGYELAIKTAIILKQKGIRFKWHFVGDGPQIEYLLSLVLSKGLKDYIIFEGGQLNPYKYIYNANIYVQPSLTEGWCLTLQEARILNKPIVTTNFATAYEQIKNGETGLIVEKTPQAIADAIIELINNEELRNKVINNLKLENQNVKIENVFEFPI